jgi:hypothetical protein
VDSLSSKHYDFSPYNYVLDNPLKFIDPEGKQVQVNPQDVMVYYIEKELAPIKQKLEEINGEASKISERVYEEGKAEIERLATSKVAQEVFEFTGKMMSKSGYRLVAETGAALQSKGLSIAIEAIASLTISPPNLGGDKGELRFIEENKVVRRSLSEKIE